MVMTPSPAATTFQRAVRRVGPVDIATGELVKSVQPDMAGSASLLVSQIITIKSPTCAPVGTGRVKLTLPQPGDPTDTRVGAGAATTLPPRFHIGSGGGALPLRRSADQGRVSPETAMMKPSGLSALAPAVTVRRSQMPLTCPGPMSPMESGPAPNEPAPPPGLVLSLATVAACAEPDPLAD